MKFEVISPKNETVFFTFEEDCLPTKSEINVMLKSGYKIKIDGKFASKKAINELLQKAE